MNHKASVDLEKQLAEFFYESPEQSKRRRKIIRDALIDDMFWMLDVEAPVDMKKRFDEIDPPSFMWYLESSH